MQYFCKPSEWINVTTCLPKTCFSASETNFLTFSPKTFLKALSSSKVFVFVGGKQAASSKTATATQKNCWQLQLLQFQIKNKQIIQEIAENSPGAIKLWTTFCHSETSSRLYFPFVFHHSNEKKKKLHSLISFWNNKKKVIHAENEDILFC